MGSEAREAMDEWPWGEGRGELFERGAGTDGHAQHKVLFPLPSWQGEAGGPRDRIPPRSAAEPISVVCQGKACSVEVCLFSLLPAATALVPVLLQLGEGWLGRTARSWRWWEGAR